MTARHRWRILLAAFGISAVVVTAFIVGRPPTPGEPSASSDEPTTAARVSAEPRADVVGAWWVVTPEPVGAPVVHVGTIGGAEAATLALEGRDAPAEAQPLIPRVVGASRGVVVTLVGDGSESVLTAVVAATGETRELHRSRDLIIDARIGGDSLFFLTADDASGEPIGLWRIPLPDGGAPEPVRGVVHDEAAAEIRLAAVVDWITELLVSDDGTVVGVHRCVQLSCELRAANLDSGERWQVDLEFGAGPLAIFDGFAVLEPACVDVDCRVELLDLDSGARLPAPTEHQGPIFDVGVVAAPEPAIVRTADGPLLAPGRGPIAVEVLDIAALEVRTLAVDLGSLVLPGRWGSQAGLELAPGTTLVIGSPRAIGDEVPEDRYYVLDIGNGTVLPVPELGTFTVNG